MPSGVGASKSAVMMHLDRGVFEGDIAIEN